MSKRIDSPSLSWVVVTAFLLLLSLDTWSNALASAFPSWPICEAIVYSFLTLVVAISLHRPSLTYWLTRWLPPLLFSWMTSRFVVHGLSESLDWSTAPKTFMAGFLALVGGLNLIFGWWPGESRTRHPCEKEEKRRKGVRMI